MSPFGGFLFDAHLRVRFIVAGILVGPSFLVLGLIFPFVVGPGVAISCEHFHDHKEEDCFVGDCSAGSPCLFLTYPGA